MTSAIAPLTDTCRPGRPSQAHHEKVRDLHLRNLFADDPKRGERLTAEAVGLYLDYSKNRITDETLELLLQLADESGLRARIDAMFRGEKINVTENRAVLHVALRAPRGRRRSSSTARTWCPQVHAVLDKMADFADRVRSGEWKGHTGKRIRNVVNIGIGGSDLGPVMAYEALRHYSDRDHDLPLRLERRRHRLRGGHPRPRPGGNAVHRLVEDLHHAGDDDQRAHARATGRSQALGDDAARSPSTSSPSRPTPQKVAEVRHRHRQHVRVLGLGRRALLDGLGDRPLDDARHRPGQLPRHARRLPRRWTSTSAPRRSSATCRCSWACWPSGTTTSSARRPWRSCRTSST